MIGSFVQELGRVLAITHYCTQPTDVVVSHRKFLDLVVQKFGVVISIATLFLRLAQIYDLKRPIMKVGEESANIPDVVSVEDTPDTRQRPAQTTPESTSHTKSSFYMMTNKLSWRIRSSITQRHGEQPVADVSEVQVEVSINVVETTTVLADCSLQLPSKCPLQSIYQHIPCENDSQQVHCDLCAPTVCANVSGTRYVQAVTKSDMMQNTAKRQSLRTDELASTHERKTLRRCSN